MDRIRHEGIVSSSFADKNLCFMGSSGSSQIIKKFGWNTNPPVMAVVPTRGCGVILGAFLAPMQVATSAAIMPSASVKGEHDVR